MRYLFLLLFLLGSRALAQTIDVRFDQSIFDFGYIKEADGKVYTEFEFQNYSNQKIRISEVISSCGCAVATSEKEDIAPMGKGKIRVSYDPMGRPGKFIKSFEVHFISDSLKKSAYLNIRGYTIEKELLETYIDDLYEGTELMIKSFKSAILSASDLRFLSDEKWQHFINDITYEIDQNGFANVQVALTVTNDKDCKDLGKGIYPVVHRNIINELERRKYNSWSVGFMDTCYGARSSDGAWGNELKISSVQYNNDTIPESGFYFSGKEINFSDFLLKSNRDSIDFEKRIFKRVTFTNKKSLDPEKNKEYQSFLTLLNRKILVDKQAYTGLSVEVKCRKEDQEKIKLKMLSQVKEIITKINLDADETGAVIEKIHHAVPEINFLIDSTQKPGKFIQRQWNLILFYPALEESPLRSPFEEFVRMDSSGQMKLKDFLTQTGFKAPYQNLPVLEISHTGNFQLDTTTLLFQSWLKIIRQESKSGHKLELLIESSVGRNSLSTHSESEYLARKNAKKLNDELKKILVKNSINDTLTEIEVVSTLVQGSAYSGKEFQMSFNQSYNYLKVIPKYTKKEKELKVALIPYQISFNNNSFDLPVKTAIFQNFISRLVLVLENEGMINIIVESSSSKIPSTVYKSNELLSYYRAEQAVQKVKEEIRKRGYDPSRVLVTEMRTLVQGPDFNSEADRKKHPYERYQYVKIIPTELIKK